MIKLLAKIVILFAPIIALGLFVLYVDPFNYYDMFNGIPGATKKDIAYGINAVLWNAIDYAHAPSPNIIIGDSRSELISAEYLKEKSGRQFKHLAAYAGKINEIADFFWFANSYAKLETIYIVLNFNMYNQYAYANRVVGAEAAIKNPFLYIFDRNVIEASYLVLNSVLQNKKISVSKPPMSKDDFWTWTLNNWPNQHYGKWRYPINGYNRLREISDYCNSNNIKLIFIIPPHHVDYQKEVSKYNLCQEQIRFKNDLSKLSTTYDYDNVNELTKDKDKFSDPIHMGNDVANIIIDEIITGNLRYGKLLTHNDVLTK